jgi:subtilisin family serine protease
VTGKGCTVAVLDTGINPSHAAFSGRIKKQINFAVQGPPTDNATDGNGHGSNVSGIIVGTGVQSVRLHPGIAPEAEVVAVKVLSDRGRSVGDSIDRGLKWVLDQVDELKISCVCMSLGSTTNFTSDTGSEMANFRKILQSLAAKNVVVCIATGNDYFPHQSQEGHAFPGICRECVSVGAIYDSAEGPFSYGSGAIAFASGPDFFTPFTQRLSKEVGDPNCFTTVFAPGAPITSAGPGSSTSLTTQHGTSQATPVVCGVVLLIQQLWARHHHALPTVDQVKEIIRTGVSIVDGAKENDNVRHTHKTFIRVDCVHALTAVPTPLVPLRPAPNKITGVVKKGRRINDKRFYEVVQDQTEISFMCCKRPTALQMAEALVPLNLKSKLDTAVTVTYTERAGNTLYGASL